MDCQSLLTRPLLFVFFYFPQGKMSAQWAWTVYHFNCIFRCFPWYETIVANLSLLPAPQKQVLNKFLHENSDSIYCSSNAFTKDFMSASSIHIVLHASKRGSLGDLHKFGLRKSQIFELPLVPQLWNGKVPHNLGRFFLMRKHGWSKMLQNHN